MRNSTGIRQPVGLMTRIVELDRGTLKASLVDCHRGFRPRSSEQCVVVVFNIFLGSPFFGIARMQNHQVLL